MAGIPCPKCGAAVKFNRASCTCGRFIGFPNVRKAEGMRADLDRHYDAAVADGASRGAKSKLDALETTLRASIATINIGPKLLYNIAAGQNYTSYYKALSENLREIAEEQYHAQRSKVDDVIHPGYAAVILYAALSPDGRGLTNYGPITLHLLEVSIVDRSSVMRENSFNFFERNDLGAFNAKEEPGWRSVWDSRHKLGVAHLASAMTSATALSDIPNHILSSGAARADDRYMEVHIYGELSWQALSCVVLERALTDPGEQDDWDFGRQKLMHRGVEIVDRVNP